ncbi:heterogeneous nuclear ribonucleoprotein A0 isoform X2 [Megalobrama amblycephala]|nr:heterogeneous nuclear ribonucleoprotein A0 isoform X2 [Megalobrama amblycephala]
MESTQPLYICISEENKEFLNSGEWDYGIVVTDLNPYVTNSELHSFFQKFGTITECNIKTDKSSGWPKGVGFVRYSSSKEAEAAQADGPHNLGGFPILINRVVTPKLNQACQLNTQDQSFQPNVCVN